MATPSVKVSNRYQIAVPQQARKRLKIKSGDRLLVDVQDGMLILMPEPKNYTEDLTGLHHESGKDRPTYWHLVSPQSRRWYPHQHLHLLTCPLA